MARTHRVRLVFACLAIFALSSDLRADIVTIIDTTPGTATNDGTIGSGEYVGSGSGINGGFGNVWGSASTLFVDSSTSGALNFGLRKGSGSYNDIGVIYIDSKSGGFSTTSGFTDVGDPGRKAVSGYDGIDRATLNFASTFLADYAITIQSGFSGLYELANGGSHNFITATNLNGTSATSADKEVNLTLANIGLPSGVGASFRYVATYISDTAFRSDEFHGLISFAGGNPGRNTVNLAAGSYNTFISAVPEVTPMLAVPVAVFVATAIGAYLRTDRPQAHVGKAS